jgi:hypothetical protein
MSEPKPFSPGKLVCGILSSAALYFEYAEEKLSGLFGPIDLKSPNREFDATDYYEQEMGPGLRRIFLSFERLIRPEDLSEIKLKTNALEESIRARFRSERRIVNLDPGYLSAAALIMATAKDFSHRVPLQHGIYAHLEFLFHKNGIQLLPWTYPDLRGDRYRAFFLEARRVYSAQLMKR